MNFDTEITCYLFQTCTTIVETPQHINCFKKKIYRTFFLFGLLYWNYGKFYTTTRFSHLERTPRI